jgi:hypothetical protein
MEDAWLSYWLAYHCKRLSHVAAGRDFWRDCLELYAAEAGPLWRAV